jgi:diketogulonate reductase-like aldo/keto reductase
VLPKSYTAARILENSQIFDWELTGEDYEKIATIEQKATLPGPMLEGGRIYNEGLWDAEHE